MVRLMIIIGCLVAGLAVVLILLPNRAIDQGQALEGIVPGAATKRVGTSAIGHGGPDPPSSPRGTQPPQPQSPMPDVSR